MFSPANAVQVTLGGLATGSLYAVILLGIILVFQVSRSINFAYGPTGMLGTFASYALYSQFGLPVWSAVIIGIGVTVLIAALTDLLIIRRLPPQQGFDVVVTLGELLLLTALAQLVFGASAQSYLKLLTDVPIVSRNIFVNGNDVLAILLGAGVTAGGYFVLNRTSLGVSLRAAAADSAVAQSVGINVRGLRTAAWAVSGVFVAVGAMMFAARLSVNDFYMTSHRYQRVYRWHDRRPRPILAADAERVRHRTVSVLGDVSFRRSRRRPRTIHPRYRDPQRCAQAPTRRTS